MSKDPFQSGRFYVFEQHAIMDQYWKLIGTALYAFRTHIKSLQEAHHKAALQESVGRAETDKENMCKDEQSPRGWIAAEKAGNP